MWEFGNVGIREFGNAGMREFGNAGIIILRGGISRKEQGECDNAEMGSWGNLIIP